MNYDANTFQEILEFSALAHANQEYKLNEPEQKTNYLHHIGLVTSEVFGLMINSREDFDYNLMLACALLHDTIEDNPDVTYELLIEKFGKNIADGVLALTKDESLPKDQQMPDSLARIKVQPKEIWCVKLADRIVNLNPPPYDWPHEKTIWYANQADLIYDELSSASPHLASRLKGKIVFFRETFC